MTDVTDAPAAVMPLELYDEMFNRLDAPPAQGWRPEPGSKLAGKLIERDTGSSEFGTYPLLTVQTPEGNEVAVHAFHTVLKNEVEKRNPQIGDFIAIKYEGLMPPKDGGQEYESYRFIVRPAPSSAGQ